MKLLAIFLFTSIISYAQQTPEEFAHNVLSACITKDSQSYEQYIATKEDIASKLKNNDPTTSDEQVTKIFTLCKDRAITGFKLWQDMADKLNLDFREIKIIETKVQDIPFKIFRDGKEIKTTPTKTIKIYFNCSGKKLCFEVKNGFYLNGKWLLGYDQVQLEWIN